MSAGHSVWNKQSFGVKCWWSPLILITVFIWLGKTIHFSKWSATSRRFHSPINLISKRKRFLDSYTYLIPMPCVQGNYTFVHWKYNIVLYRELPPWLPQQGSHGSDTRATRPPVPATQSPPTWSLWQSNTLTVTLMKMCIGHKLGVLLLSTKFCSKYFSLSWIFSQLHSRHIHKFCSVYWKIFAITLQF
jgi:hypothetical protein